MILRRSLPLLLLSLLLVGCQSTPRPPTPEALRPILQLLVRDGTVVALVNRPEIALLVVQVTRDAESLLQDPPDFAALQPAIVQALDRASLAPWQQAMVGNVVVGMLTLAGQYLDRHQVEAVAKATYARDILHWIQEGASLVSPPL